VCVLAAGDDGRVELHALMALLGDRGVQSLLVEGGGVLHGGLFAAGLVDKVHAIIAPKIVGGDAYPAVAGAGAQRMANAITLRDVEVLRLGSDVAFVGYV
jgi:diaminohydroxyphosphoribosylaminopyrimidine deaminase/5-amino-6-(5-phosphoribosylamino)uracil reductase